MASSPLGSFDPFATHPFTNGSGIIPQAPYPSQYPMQFASAQRQSQTYYPSSPPTHYSSYAPSSTSSGASTPSTSPSTPLYSPRPHRASPSNAKPIFVPFQRSDASSPELVLKKKVPYMTNTMVVGK
ncbi:hypothetical protein CC1G_03900 [Coprinopsis cinerea okayama7|uniref:Uncharacterized protein n=1 Tax=Coprinopsis cinerea (strain Okayama-7 / 130 / ATCC MYA-4618 / FGSC 9003) TaxID=240176 RepID=A8NH52_COPC7|nr:hypothetical protein CC1G_03900 [Coprinopsis cinerea okayama7\|eukprot:XP_001833683.1 hypothetical protein CC1G_03900 [Coprinopsis cinerea okayama7\